MLGIPFDQENRGAVMQDADPETGDWWHEWDLPAGVALHFVPWKTEEEENT